MTKYGRTLPFFSKHRWPARFENQTVQALERAVSPIRVLSCSLLTVAVQKSTQRVWIELMTQFGNVKQVGIAVYLILGIANVSV